MNISINIQSYKRAGLIDTARLLPFFFIWCHEFEAEEYRKFYGDKVKVLPDGLRGNLPLVKNYILDHSENDDVTVFLDDDIQVIQYWEKGIKRILQKEKIIEFIEKYSLIAEEMGVYLWGINLNPDKQIYREYSPFSTLSYISSSFSCFMKGNKLRYDKRFPLKEDYDMFIQQCFTYRRVLRVNKFFYQKKSAENVGGCATYRNIDVEIDQLKLLQKKWGDRVVKMDSLNYSRSHKSSKKRNFDINPVISIPIRGI